MTDNTPPTGPAAEPSRSAEEWHALMVNWRWIPPEGMSAAQCEINIIEQAMAQAHAAGREEVLEQMLVVLDNVRDGTSNNTPCGYYARSRLGVLEAGIDALRTASAQPTATEASE